MKNQLLLILSLITLSVSSQQCFDFSQYTQTQLQGMINATAAGSSFVQQGDIALVRLDSSLTISSVTSSAMVYYGFPGLGFDVSSFTSDCKTVTLTGALFELYVDGDSISNPTGGAEFAYNGGNYTVHRDASYNYTIEGEFNTFHLSSTNSIESICIAPCAPTSNCFDFTRYTTTQLGDLAATTPVGDIIVQQGDISLVRIDSSIIGIDVIDTVTNELSFYGFAGLGFDVSTFPSSCKKVTFSGMLFDLYVDNITISNTSYPYSGTNFTASRDTLGNTTIEGDFDLFHFYSTNIIRNICIEACDSVTAIEDPIQLSFNVYPNPVTDIIHLDISLSTYETILIMAMDGRIVKQVKATKNINVANLANGAYKLLLTSNKGVTGSATFIKK